MKSAYLYGAGSQSRKGTILALFDLDSANISIVTLSV